MQLIPQIQGALEREIVKSIIQTGYLWDLSSWNQQWNQLWVSFAKYI